MYKPKKLLSVLLVMALAANLLGSLLYAYAEQSDSLLTYTLQPSYMVAIPETVEIPFNETSYAVGAVTVSDAHIEVGKCVKVALENAESLALLNTEDSHKIPFTITDGAGKTFVAKCYTENTTDNLVMKITQEDWDAATTGSYSATATFNISYEDMQ